MAPQPRLLADLLRDVPGARLYRGSADTLVHGICQDTRRLSPGELFVAIPGFRADGLAFAVEAAARGASAVVAESVPAEIDGLPVVQVPSARAALAELAASFYRHPSRKLQVVGVTGTDGKTTTTQLISAILEAHGLTTGWLTTVNTKVGAEVHRNAVDHTTPEATLVQRGLAEMVEAGVDVAILETSSHALALDRVRGTRFSVGVFTNLSPEHLNFHGSFEAYRDAKARLFAMLPPDGLAALNADDPSCDALVSATTARVLKYSMRGRGDVVATDVRATASGTTFTVQVAESVSAARGEDARTRSISTRLIGDYNVANWLAAFAASSYFGATLDDLATAAARQQPVPGRMNLVDRGQPFLVVVDFAHTPQALRHTLGVLRGLIAGRVLLAFGNAGGRDQTNRPAMGQIAREMSDFFLVTMDDPGDEDPSAIAQQAVAGAESAGGGAGERYGVELDRRTAIRELLRRARPGDAVLLAGKGHEQRMVLRDGPVPWNDTEVATEELSALGYSPRTG